VVKVAVISNASNSLVFSFCFSTCVVGASMYCVCLNTKLEVSIVFRTVVPFRNSVLFRRVW